MLSILVLFVLVGCQTATDDTADPGFESGFETVEVSCPLDEPSNSFPGTVIAYTLERSPALVQVWGCADLEDGPTCANVWGYMVTGDHEIIVDENICQSYEYLDLVWTY